jgi:hypothetical protein
MTDDQVQRGMRKCPICRGEIYRANLFRADALFVPEAEDEPEVIEMDEKPDFEILEGRAGPSTTQLGKRPSVSRSTIVQLPSRYRGDICPRIELTPRSARTSSRTSRSPNSSLT